MNSAEIKKHEMTKIGSRLREPTEVLQPELCSAASRQPGCPSSRCQSCSSIDLLLGFKRLITRPLLRDQRTGFTAWFFSSLQNTR